MPPPPPPPPPPRSWGVRRATRAAPPPPLRTPAPTNRPTCRAGSARAQGDHATAAAALATPQGGIRAPASRARAPTSSRAATPENPLAKRVAFNPAAAAPRAGHQRPRSAGARGDATTRVATAPPSALPPLSIPRSKGARDSPAAAHSSSHAQAGRMVDRTGGPPDAFFTTKEMLSRAVQDAVDAAITPLIGEITRLQQQQQQQQQQPLMLWPSSDRRSAALHTPTSRSLALPPQLDQDFDRLVALHRSHEMHDAIGSAAARRLHWRMMLFLREERRAMQRPHALDYL